MVTKMIDEFRELNERIGELRKFISDSDQIKNLDHLNQDLLVAQLNAMETYISILSIRIGLNKSNE